MGGLWVDFAEGREDRRCSRSARRATRRRTSPASTPAARSTSRSTAPTASAPTRWSRASTPARSAAPRWCATAGRRRRSCRPPTRRSPRREEALGGRVPRIAAMNGPENPHVLAEEMGDWMTDNVTVIRENGKLRETETKLAGAVGPLEPHRPDRSLDLRQPRDLLRQPAAQHARARARDDARRAPARRIARRALQGPGPRRRRSTRANVLPRDDANFLKTTMAEHTPDGPKITYAPVDTSLDQARGRGSTDDAATSMHRSSCASSARTRRPPRPTGRSSRFPYQPGQNVISRPDGDRARTRRRATGSRTSPVVYDRACLEEVCGSCAMRINGVSRMACTALVDQLEQPIRLEPMAKFPVLRDLAVDRQPMFDALKRVQAWIPIDGTYDLGPGPRMAEAERQAGLRVLPLHHVRQLPRRLPAGQRPLQLHRRRGDRAGAALQHPSDRGDERGRAPRGAHGRRRHRRLRQRAELRARLPEGDSADDRDRRDVSGDDACTGSRNCSADERTELSTELSGLDPQLPRAAQC